MWSYQLCKLDTLLELNNILAFLQKFTLQIILAILSQKYKYQLIEKTLNGCFTIKVNSSYRMFLHLEQLMKYLPIHQNREVKL